MIKSKFARFAIMAIAIILVGSVVGVLEYRKYQETAAVKSLLTSLTEQDFEQVYDSLSEEISGRYEDSEALKAAYIEHDNPLPVEWTITLVPDNNDGDFYKGTLIDTSGRTFRWAIHPTRPFMDNGPFHIARWDFTLVSE